MSAYLNALHEEGTREELLTEVTRLYHENMELRKPRPTLQPSGLFHTPKDWDELMAWIEEHNPSDRPHLVTAALMAWNLACKLSAPTPTHEA